MVLPSIERNILPQNPDCDIFVHFYYQEEEPAGRLNDGGRVNPNEILFLQNSIQKQKDNASSSLSSSLRVIQFVNDTRKEFFQKRQDQLLRYHDACKKPFFYFWPWRRPTWEETSLDNMIMQWHSIERSFHLMENYAHENNIDYTRVAMLRNDVLYLTPIDILQLDKETKVMDSSSSEKNNQRFVVPGFCQYPVNDRMIYGPYDAVRVWSTERFHLLETKIQQQQQQKIVMHSEIFMKESIFPAIQQQYELYINPDICFIRTRAESIALTDDCTTQGIVRDFDNNNVDMKDLVERTIGRKCILEEKKYDNNKKRKNQVQCV